MAEYVICDKEEITSIADTIRSATGTTETMSLQGIKAGVKSLKPVQPDWSQNDETAQDYVKNRTHYESIEVVNEPLNLTWDGNTEGLVSAINIAYKVSDIVLTEEQILSATITLNNGESANLSEDYIKATDEIFLGGYGFIAFVNTDNAILSADDGTIFPEAGIYFVKYEQDQIYVASLSTSEPVEHTKTVAHKIDKKFLPFNEFKMIAITGEFRNGEFSCNLPFEEAYDLVESNNGLVLGIYKDRWDIEFSYLSMVTHGFGLSGEKYVEFIFKRLDGRDEKKFWYLEDGTLTTNDPNPK